MQFASKLRMSWIRALAGLGLAASLAQGAMGAEKAASSAAAIERGRSHWAFQPLRPSTAEELDRLLNPPIPPEHRASRRTLVRRAFLDLTGLPPTPEEAARFETDANPAAWERLTDQLLASRHYGERWARHWLDLARYADSDGYETDRDRPNAWPYRDWVIRAFNADLPYHTFISWQIAGDELDPANPDAVTATGFLSAGPIADTTPADTEENKLKIRYDELDDMVSTTGSAMLGLTLGCARCHDHKFDPIPTRDYYRLLSAFQTTQRADARLSKPHREREHWLDARRRELREAKMTELGLTEDQRFWLRQPEHFFIPIQVDLYKKFGAKLKTTDDELRARLPARQKEIWEALNQACARAEAASPETAAKALIVFDEQPEPRPTFLLHRGSVTDRSEPVTLGFLQVLQHSRLPEDYLAAARPAVLAMDEVDDSGFRTARTTWQRKALASWLADADQGAGQLLARVLVNRLWQHHFGEGLVRTPGDFGAQGEKPARPELLDALASEFIRQGWRIKPLHRLILRSALYRQAASQDRPPIRLEAEALRDAMLAVSGRLNRKMFGPPFRPIIPKEAIATRSKDEYPTDIKDGVELWRRSVYAFVKRSVPNPLMDVFDAPDSNAACSRRNTTTVPTQALTLLNDGFVRQCATQFAQRVVTETGLEPKAQIRRAYQLALSREPVPAELAKALAFLDAARDARGEGIPVEGLTDLCHALFTLNEFVYVD